MRFSYSMTGGVTEFDRLVSIFEGDLKPLEKAAQQAIKLGDKVEARWKSLKIVFGKPGDKLGFAQQVDTEMRQAMADIRKFQSERARIEREQTRLVEREERQRNATRNKEQRKAANDFLAHMRRVNAEERKASQKSTLANTGLGQVAGYVGAGALVARAGMFINEGREAYQTLDRLVRFVATLDERFQSADGIRKFRNDLLQLSTEVPQTSESLAKAAFTIKSAYQDMTEPQLIDFLRKFSVQATASNTTVDQHAERVVALAKKYGYTADQLDKFGAIMTSTFGAALSQDADVAAGFNSLITPAATAGQSLNELAAAMGTVQSNSSDAEQATTGLKNVLFKFIDPKFAEKLKETFGVSLTDAQGKFKGLNQIVHEVAKELDGLTDEQKMKKIGSVFTDQREATGFLTLIANIKQYDELLKQGGDTEAFTRKTNVMMDSADAKWQRLVDRVDQYKTAVGALLSDASMGTWSDVGTSVLDLQGADPTEKWVAMLLQAMGVGKTTVEKGGKETGELYGRSVMLGIDGQAGAVQTSAQNLVPATVPGASEKGMTIGQQWALGIAEGIRASSPVVGSAATGVINWLFSRSQKEQDSHSPSRRSARELGVPFIQGIAVGMKMQEASLGNAAAAVISHGMYGPKTKQKVKEVAREIREDLQYAFSRIDPETQQAEAATNRFYDAILADHTQSFADEANAIAEHYEKIEAIEDAAYQRRLANIAEQEQKIRDAKDLKPREKATALRELGDRRTDLSASREQGLSERRKDLESGIREAGLRAAERAQREFARTFMETENSMIGIRRTAEQSAQDEYDADIKQKDAWIQRLKDLQSTFPETSKAYRELSNDIADAEQDRADAVIQGTGKVKAARQQDKDDAKQFALDLKEYGQEVLGAEQATVEQRLELLRASGASEEAIWQAEAAVAFQRENLQHDQYTRELERGRDDLLSRASTGEQKLQIERDYNLQIEQENQRHNAAMGTITADNDHTVLGTWKRLFKQLPTWKDEFRSFARDLPQMWGDMWSNALQNSDGTWKGFMHSLYNEFLKTLQQMFAELFRTQMMKLLIGLGTSLFGGLFGGGGGGTPGKGFLASPGGVKGFGGGFHFADGGTPPVNRVSVVGERGPEIFVPNVAGRVLSHEDSMKAVGGRGNGGGTTIVNINQTFKGPRGLTPPKSTRQQSEAALNGVLLSTRRHQSG